MIIPAEDAHFPQVRQRDSTGRVLVWKDRVFRAIFPESEAHVRALLSSGLVHELARQGFIPKTWPTEYGMNGYSLILEHERVWPVIYPQEWTFSMLKDAAILVCRIAAIAKDYGYNMRDCHGLNVLFDGVSPRFTDLGSFIPDECPGWSPYEEFLRFYYYPLQIWRHNSFVGKLSVFSGNLTQHDAYWLYRCQLCRILNPNLLDRLIRLRLLPERLASRPVSQTSDRLWSRDRILYELVRRGIVPAKSVKLHKLVSEIEDMTQRQTRSPWASYHDDIQQKAMRFDRIVEIVNRLEGELETAVDLGGNQGRFSRLLVQRTRIQRAICVDSDEGAIDKGYNGTKQAGGHNIAYCHYDFMGVIAKLRFALPTERFKSDVAFALALTHHLLLTHGYELDHVFRSISAYARRYVFIEFMPRGLWPTEATPQLPSWYTRDWFRQSFATHFEPVLEENLRESNVLFVGRVRPNSHQMSS